MIVTVNGSPTELVADANVADAVTQVTGQLAGVAVALNGAVVPRSGWPSTPLRPGDRVEVLTAVQGG